MGDYFICKCPVHSLPPHSTLVFYHLPLSRNGSNQASRDFCSKPLKISVEPVEPVGFFLCDSSRANILRAATTYGLVKSVQMIFHSHSCQQRIAVGNLETHVAMHLGPFALLSRRFLPTSLQEFVVNHLPWCALGGLFLRCQAGPKWRNPQ